MRRILLKIAYDGTNYNGWQNGTRHGGIEDVLNEKISELTGEKIKIFGVSRTDSGVHANCNFATFDTESNIEPSKYYFALNNILPNDISILESKEVSFSFDVKHISCKKTYIYRIHNAKVRNPLKEHNAFFCFYDTDIEKMREASKYLIGVHDFISFINPESQTLTLAKNNGFPLEKITTREIYDIKIEKIDDIITMTFIGSGFMYHMVRILAGTILNAGMNMIEPSYIKEIMDKKNRRYAGHTLPAKGLTLENIEFV